MITLYGSFIMQCKALPLGSLLVPCVEWSEKPWFYPGKWPEEFQKSLGKLCLCLLATNSRILLSLRAFTGGFRTEGISGDCLGKRGNRDWRMLLSLFGNCLSSIKTDSDVSSSNTSKGLGTECCSKSPPRSIPHALPSQVFFQCWMHILPSLLQIKERKLQKATLSSDFSTPTSTRRFFPRAAPGPVTPLLISQLHLLVLCASQKGRCVPSVGVFLPWNKSWGRFTCNVLVKKDPYFCFIPGKIEGEAKAICLEGDAGISFGALRKVKVLAPQTTLGWFLTK